MRRQGLFLRSFCIPAIAHGKDCSCNPLAFPPSMAVRCAGAAKYRAGIAPAFPPSMAVRCARAAIHGGQMRVSSRRTNSASEGAGARNAVVPQPGRLVGMAPGAVGQRATTGLERADVTRTVAARNPSCKGSLSKASATNENHLSPAPFHTMVQPETQNECHGSERDHHHYVISR